MFTNVYVQAGVRVVIASYGFIMQRYSKPKCLKQNAESI